MRGGVDIGIHAQRNARLDAAAGGQRIDQRQLGFGFAVEAFDLVLERVVDLLRSFADAGEDDGPRIGAGFQHAKQLAAGNDVESRAGFGEQLQDRQIAVGLDGIADLVRNIAEGALVGLKSIEDRGARVDVAGRAFAARDVGQGQFFEIQRLIAILHYLDFQDDQGLIVVRGRIGFVVIQVGQNLVGDRLPAACRTASAACAPRRAVPYSMPFGLG